ncbi:DUF2797 domain-containing protein [Actinocrinis puniceicyclus]|uniref:DUF2797 domain-containing protein n=1 Tax=Actinocrinis puniceicyclus TaxID=977794 RepID=A0A8J7WU79_9ACTN|nr:DUF2797 domain-containing protein [Actinocrinis puniceicyclus]MBS2966567.1 DUF2797 domain-containing protein [Actinocrinis puniceicyclus]
MIADMLFLGIDWADPDQPQVRMAPADGGASILSRWDEALQYRSAAPTSRYCCGYFDLSTQPPAHVTCQRRRLIPRGSQCTACRVAEGFSSAHRAHLAAALPPHVRVYLDQPHWLYLAIFADGSCKVGTAAESRYKSRLAEQGA